jgi:polysaccharide deacetylase family protein (PEP-CTERM system associated)
LTVHALTIDLEDWHQLVGRRVTGRLGPPTRAVVDATYRLLDLLDEAGVQATFFVLGLVAEAFPELIGEVVRRGHEVGSHTYSHELIYRMEPAAFKADMERSVKQLQDLTGRPVVGFRAPEFSVGHLKHWCFEILAGLGIRYDSSVFPIAGVRYGIPGAPRLPFTIDTPSGPVREFPLATWDLGRFRLPVAGGTYFRLFPGRVLRRAIASAEASGRLAVLYFHPYEFSDRFLRLDGLTARQWMRPCHIKYTALHNVSTCRIASRLRFLLSSFSFRTLEEHFRHEHVGNGPRP